MRTARQQAARPQDGGGGGGVNEYGTRGQGTGSTLRGQVDTAVESVTRDAMSSGAHARCKRPNARHSLPFSSYFSTVESDGVTRQEAQIVQSELNLDEFLPRITRP